MCISTNAQEKVEAAKLTPAKIAGKIVDAETGDPITGANIYVEGTLQGQVSNINGDFDALHVKEGQTIIISFVGAKDQYIVFNGQKYLKVELEQDLIALEAVVAVGYGVQERRDLTGSVAQIDGAEIAGIAPSFDNALVGKVAGVNVNLSSGAPGSATSIVIRGLSSINADNNPLIVIDGVPVYGTGKLVNNVSFDDGTAAPGVIGGNSISSGYTEEPEFERNPLAALNPEDIESIEILKDAFSTAIYGSRGAAGVILVTTKRGVKGKPQIKVGHSVTLSNPVNTPDLLDANQFSSVYEDYYSSIGRSTDFPTTHNTDWLDHILRTGITHETSVSVSGANETASYYISFNRFDQEGYVINQDLSRNSFRTNFEFRPTRKISFGSNSTFSFIDNSALNSQSIYREAILMSPNIPVYNDDNSYFYHSIPQLGNNINPISSNKNNPVATAHQDNYSKDARVISNVYAEIKPFSWLSFKTEVGLDMYSTKSYNRIWETPSSGTLKGSGSEGRNHNLKYVINNVVSIRKLIDKHAFNVTLGQSFEASEEGRLRISGRGFFDDSEQSIGRATDKRVLEALTQEWAIASYFVRANYRYNNKYLAGITYRIDGSSQFSANQRYRGFPSVSSGWIISEEDFMDNAYWVDNLKLRGSYGLTGLSGSFEGYYGNQGTWTRNLNGGNSGTLLYNGVPLLFNKQVVNPNLDWETTTSLDIGVDASLFDGRMEVVLDYFYKRTNNLLTNDNVPLYMGWSSQQQNLGDMRNSGIEFSVNGTIIENNDFSWTASFNVSRIQDKLLKLTQAGYQIASNNYVDLKVYKVGESISQFYLYDWAGVNPLDGNPQWRYEDGTLSTTPPEANRNSNIPLANRYASGSSMPDFYGGLNTAVRYKGLELSLAFSYSVGQKMFNGAKASLLTYMMNDANNLSTDILDSWIIVGHKTDIPKLDNLTTRPAGRSQLSGYDVSRMSDRFLEDASYLRLRNITLGYTLTNPLVKSMQIDRIRFYAQGVNLLTFTNYTGVDPEVNAFGSSATLSGYDELTMPQAKSFKLGANIVF